MPLSVVLSSLIKFAIQFAIFIVVLIAYIASGTPISPNAAVLILPLLLILMSILGLSLGMIVSALTTKYRDLRFLMTFGVQLLMYATPVIYPVSALPKQYQMLLIANPITPIVEAFRFAFLGRGSFDYLQLGMSAVIASVLLGIALVIFNQVEKNFMDTV